MTPILRLEGIESLKVLLLLNFGKKVPSNGFHHLEEIPLPGDSPTLNHPPAIV
jgi:hypothetical protein